VVLVVVVVGSIHLPTDALADLSMVAELAELVTKVETDKMVMEIRAQ
jgi:hypothetical protein